MHISTRSLASVLAAALVLALAATAASALRSLSIEGTTTLTGNGTLTFNGSEGGVTIVCPTTVTGTINRLIPKVEGTATGHITEIRIGPPEARCRSNVGTLKGIQPLGLGGNGRAELWQTFYQGFSGVLPQITRLRGILKHLQLSVEIEVPLIGLVTCLYESEPEGGHADAEVDSRGVVGRGEIGLNHGRLVRSSNAFCPRTGELVGQMTPLQTTVVRLI